MWFRNVEPLISLCNSHLLSTVWMCLETLYILTKLGLLNQCAGDASLVKTHWLWGQAVSGHLLCSCVTLSEGHCLFPGSVFTSVRPGRSHMAPGGVGWGWGVDQLFLALCPTKKSSWCLLEDSGFGAPVGRTFLPHPPPACPLTKTMSSCPFLCAQCPPHWRCTKNNCWKVQWVTSGWTSQLLLR